jgi:preprotein translocase subunit SecA/nephrocystin-3
MNQLCQNYIKDESNFEALDTWLTNEDSHHFVVTGASGLGKSALIANWLKEKLSDNNCEHNIIYHFTGNGGSESNSDHIIKSIANEIKEIYELEDNELETETKLEDLFVRVSAKGNKPLLIVIDAINQIVDVNNAKLLNWLPSPTRGIKILFSTLEDDRTMDVFKNRDYPIFTLQPLDVERRSQMVRSYLKLYAKSLTEKQVDRIVTNAQCENTSYCHNNRYNT